MSLNSHPVTRAVIVIVGAAVLAGGVVGTATAAADAPAPAADQVQTFQGRVIMTVHNDTDHRIHVALEGKTMTGKVERDLAPNESITAEGHTTRSPRDVTGSIRYLDGLSVPVWGYNPEIGWPGVGIGTDYQRFSEGERHSYSQQGHDFTVVRENDIGWGKDFHLHVR